MIALLLMLIERCIKKGIVYETIRAFQYILMILFLFLLYL